MWVRIPLLPPLSVIPWSWVRIPPLAPFLLGGSYVTAKRVKLTSKFITIAELYVIFAADYKHLYDFSDDMRYEMYLHESLGKPISKQNGFAAGKRWMGVNISMWKEDIAKGYLFKIELYQDGKYPHWWLDRVLR